MLRRLAPIALALSLASTLTACGKKADEAPADAAKAKKDEAAKQADAPAPTTAAPAPASDEADDVVLDGGPAPEEDRSCDPKEKGACLEGETCVGGQGCEAVWECDTKITCKKGTREYCGCDGKTFESDFGNCPGQKYQYPGPCK
jgi:hypothetical protein